MPRLPNRELEERLKAAGESLSHPPSTPDELLPLLDGTEKYLSKIEQSPATSIVTSLSQLMKALVSEKLLKHSDVDVKVGVASCISEITRITAPEAPYDDDKMKDVLQLIVSSFEDIWDTSSRSYFKRVTILETVAKVRTCVIMLDLECDQMVIEMFQHFLKAIRDYHAAVVFSSMETIMTLILVESEDISLDILNPILCTLKKNNETVLPEAKKLAERVIQSSADKLKTYLPQALKALNASSKDYSEAVASLCQDSNENTIKEQSVVKESTEETSSQAKSTETNGANETGTEEAMVDANSSKKDSDNVSDANLVSKTKSGDLGAEEPAKLEAKVDPVAKENGDSAESPDAVVSKKQPEQVNSGEDIPTSLDEVPPVEAASLENIKDTSMQLSPSEARDNEDVNVSTPVQGGSLPERNQVKRSARSKRKVKSVKKQQRSRKKQPAKRADMKDGTLIEEDESKKHGNASDSDTNSLDQTEKLKASDEENIPVAKMQKGTGKKQPAKKSEKENTLIEGESKNDGGNVSDSETEKLKVSDEDNVPVAKKQKGSGDKQPVKKGKKDMTSIEENESENDGGSDSEMHDDSPLRKVGKRRGLKLRAEKDVSKSSVREDDGEDMVTSPRSSLRTKDGNNKEETPNLSSKRKRTPGTEKASGSLEYGENLVGSKIKVWWPKDRAFYEGVIHSFDSVKKKHAVLYADGDQENLILKRQKWEFIGDDPVSDARGPAEHSSDDASPDMKKKKGTSSEASSKHVKMESSDKSKTKDIAKKSGAKSKDDDKIKPKIKDNLRSSGKSEDETIKSKDSAKATGKSKDVSKTPNNSKLDSQKSAQSKGKTPQSGKTRGSSKSSKVKETDKTKDKPMGSAKSPEIVKGKSQDTPKLRESGAKSVKKRRR